MIIFKELKFEAAHRILGHESKCAYYHGHSYKASIMVHSKELDALDRVVDFSVVKTRIGEWIKVNWDHNIILHEKDPMSLMWHANRQGAKQSVFNGKKPFIIPDEQNPTVEVMAEILGNLASLEFSDHKHVKIVGVRLYETATSSALWMPDEAGAGFQDPSGEIAVE